MTTNPKSSTAPAAGTAPDDPVFQAMAALEQLKIHAGESEAAHSVAEDAVFAARKENAVILDGKEMRTHAQIDTHFRPAFGPDDEEEFNKILGRIETLRPRCLSDTERAERDLGRQAAHDELTRQEAAIAEVEQRAGFREIEAQKDTAESAVWDAEYEVMEAKPATPSAAVALLRFVAGLMEYLGEGGEHGHHYALAICNAADFFEGSASA
jgi:hypothetical protein